MSETFHTIITCSPNKEVVANIRAKSDAIESKDIARLIANHTAASSSANDLVERFLNDPSKAFSMNAADTGVKSTECSYAFLVNFKDTWKPNDNASTPPEVELHTVNWSVLDDEIAKGTPSQVLDAIEKDAVYIA